MSNYLIKTDYLSVYMQIFYFRIYPEAAEKPIYSVLKAVTGFALTDFQIS